MSIPLFHKMKMPPFVPFYSSVVHDALVSILEGRQTSSSSNRVIEVEKEVEYDDDDAGLFVQRGGNGDDEDAEDDDDDLQSDGSDDTTSSSASSLLETLNEEDEPIFSNISLTTTGRVIDEFSSTTNSDNNNNNGGATREHPPKMKSIGRAPSTILTFLAVNHINDNSNASCGSKMGIEIPTGLFPRPIRTYDDSYNTHETKQCAMATDLLSSWNRLHGRNSDNNLLSPTIIVVLLRSGRFVSAVYSLTTTTTTNTAAEMTMLTHTTSTRYTVRKGQGGSQSNHDMSKSKAKSVGAQLRREGEKKLREDVHAAWVKFHNFGYVKRCVYVYVSCPKGMKRDYLYSTDDNNSGGLGLGLLVKGDTRWRDIPLDVGRPTLEAASLVLDCVLGCSVRQLSNEEYTSLISSSSSGGGGRDGVTVTTNNEERVVSNTTKVKSLVDNTTTTRELEIPAPPPPPPYTPLHNAVMDGDLARLIELLDCLNTKVESVALPDTDTVDNSMSSFLSAYDVNTVAGPDLRTPLHMASMLSTNADAAPGLVTTLLINGHADPTIVDKHGLPPYRTALTDGTREAYRLARGVLGEDCWAWDDDAKVPSALTSDDIKAKKAKAAEKKRRQRARQKEVKAEEKAELEAAAEKERQEAMERKQQEDAKRIRDGLRPKLSCTTATNVCDYCQQVVKGKRRSQMFQRLEYAYCSTECVKRHQRELMAAAATARIVQ
jgi:hypothetical protein